MTQKTQRPDTTFDEERATAFGLVLNSAVAPPSMHGPESPEGLTEDVDEVDVLDEQPATDKPPGELPEADEPLVFKDGVEAEALESSAEELAQFIVENAETTDGELDVEVDVELEAEAEVVVDEPEIVARPDEAAVELMNRSGEFDGQSPKNETARSAIVTPTSFEAPSSTPTAPKEVARAQQLFAEAKEIARRQAIGQNRRFTIDLPVDRGAPVRLTITPDGEAHRVALVASTGIAREELEKHREQLERVIETLPLRVRELQIDQRSNPVHRTVHSMSEGVRG